MEIYAQGTTFENLQGANGPYDSRINCIYQDSDGFIWLGTGTTVERYDGIQSLAYPFERISAEPSEHLVNAILETTLHEYWVGTVKGLWKLNHKEMKPERMFPDKIDCMVQALAKDQNNHLYIGTSNGLYVYDHSSLTHFLVEKNTLSPNNQILDIHISNHGVVWLLTYNSIVLFDSKSGNMKTFKDHTPSDRFRCFTLVNDLLYIGTENRGVRTFNPVNQVFSSFVGTTFPVSCISSDTKNCLYLGLLGGGICFYSLSNGREIYSATYNPQIKGSLASNMTASLLIDSNGSIWAGSRYYTGLDYMRHKDNGISVFSKNIFTSKDITVRSFLRDGDVTLVGTREGFYDVSDKSEEPVHFLSGEKKSEGLRSNLIFSFHRYGDKYLVGTCGGGLSVLDPVTLKFSDLEASGTLTGNDIFMFSEDKSGKLWMPSSDGLHCYDHQSGIIKSFTTFNSNLPGNIVYGSFIDSQDRFWVGTVKGICLFDPVKETFSTDSLPEGFPLEGAIRNIYEDKDGNIFICLLDGKLFVSNGSLKHFRYIFEQSPFEVYNMIQDDNGYYWLGTNIGIVRANRTLDDFNVYSVAEGVPDIVCAGSSCVKDADGILWFGTIKGLVSLDPASLNDLTPLIITNVYINGSSVYSNFDNELQKNASPILFDEKERNIGFRFVSLGYENIESMRFEYKLDGLSSNWTGITGKSEINFYDLPAGEYTFSVRKLLNNKSISSVSFVIPRSGHYWVYLLVGGLLLGVIASFWVWKKRVLSKINYGEEELPVYPEELSPKTDEEKYKYTKMNDAEAREIVNKIVAYMEAEKPYLNPDMKQLDLALATGYSTQILSQVFNVYMKERYYDFVNRYRVEEFKRLLTEIDYNKYTLASLAEKCGFSSQASFFRFFRKFTGTTPNEYIQNLNR